MNSKFDLFDMPKEHLIQMHKMNQMSLIYIWIGNDFKLLCFGNKPISNGFTHNDNVAYLKSEIRLYGFFSTTHDFNDKPTRFHLYCSVVYGLVCTDDTHDWH